MKLLKYIQKKLEMYANSLYLLQYNIELIKAQLESPVLKVGDRVILIKDFGQHQKSDMGTVIGTRLSGLVIEVYFDVKGINNSSAIELVEYSYLTLKNSRTIFEKLKMIKNVMLYNHYNLKIEEQLRLLLK